MCICRLDRPTASEIQMYLYLHLHVTCKDRVHSLQEPEVAKTLQDRNGKKQRKTMHTETETKTERNRTGRSRAAVEIFITYSKQSVYPGNICLKINYKEKKKEKMHFVRLT